ncbi:efflux RND transporter periplasmic adaptor subunit [Acanthopleuribacter pedis]|uniref:Efflux RND transporter periplasmic adaptor subunit n=1 Tax=Acanthopleuribacter pedis TaxID=442870 RepID=A0A8J7Q047_9BACT|nr:efflux RND transporter periplasmic adaptor subunit [Acanthopleuribacter pedis]MBO1317947.1 efflux RND transporter periplasmic adaptor subunit [Acanthopleuribacter pedis]
MFLTVPAAPTPRAATEVRSFGRTLFATTRPITSGCLLLLCFMMTSPAFLTAALLAEPASTAAEAGDWCAEHEVPESKCTLCNPALIPGFQAVNDWCAGHELPESICPMCSHGVPDPPPITADDWCAGHEVPESRCTICHPKLVPGFQAMGDWCAEKRLPESVCPHCNGGPLLGASVAPALSDTDSPTVPAGNDWCAGHMVPESKCTLCNPELIPGFKEAGDWCAEHELPESVCPQCKPPGIDQVPIEQRIVRFLNPEKEQEAGIGFLPIRRGDHDAVLEAPARIEFDANRVAEVRAVVPGLVQAIYISQGDRVEGTDPLFDLVSPEIGEIQAALRAATTKVRVKTQQLKRQQTLAARHIVGAWDVEQAEMALDVARAELAAAQTTLDAVGADAEGVPGYFTVRAPLSGIVVRREAGLGSHADLEHSLAKIVDTSHLWVLCELAERDGRRIRPGALLHFQGDDGQSAQGRITWIAAEVDPVTRTIPVRAEIENPNGSLRAHQFGRARIILPHTRGTWMVPREAVQTIEGRDVVFVRREQGLYQPREVQRLGEGDWVPVRGSLSAGDQVVTTGAVLLLTEMLPGSIGAGCCEVEPLGKTRGGG